MKKILFLILIIFMTVVGFLSLSDKSQKPVDNVINIVFTTDTNYKEHLKTTLYSLIKNKNPNSKYSVNILCVNFDPKGMYDRYNTNNVKINIIRPDIKKLENVGNFQVSNHVSRADLFKFFMPEIFPDLDKILYIDVDTLILKDLSELYKTDLKHKYLAAVYTFSEFNCGVILYNLKAWRKHNLTKKLVKAKNNDINRTLMTQDAFNEVIKKNKVLALPDKYNTITATDEYLFDNFIGPKHPTAKTLAEYFNEAVILHYLLKPKPWNDGYKKSEQEKLWLKYRDERIKYEK